MEKGRTFETMVGVFVIVIAVFFFNYVYTKSGWKKDDVYVLSALFSKADGILEGTDVKISGIRVGKVLNTTIDTDTFMAIVKFYVPSNVKLSADTRAAVQSDGLLGSKYLELLPGGDDTNLNNGDVIENTSSAVSIESLIGQFMLSKKEDNNATTSSQSTSADASGHL